MKFDLKSLITFILISLCLFLLSKSWGIWLLFGMIIFIIALFYFSKNFNNPFDIHVVALTLLVIYSVPSTILILLNVIKLNNQELLRVFSTMSIGITAYFFGALFFRQNYQFEKIHNNNLSVTLNKLFWLLYKYRYLLVCISLLVLLIQGIMPMSYTESIAYRIEVPGLFRYFNSLISTVFSVLLVAIISIIGDIERHKKLTWVSYILIGLVFLSIIAGHRIWIVSLGACLLFGLQKFLKRWQILLILFLGFFIILTMSGAVRYARIGKTYKENTENFIKYFKEINTLKIVDIMWGFSDFVVPFSTYLTLIKNVPENIEFDYALPLKDASLLVPTVLYKERPLPVAIWYVKTFEPEMFAKGQGKTFYVIGFGYLFAGHLGVFIYLFLFGMLFEWLNKFFTTTGDSAGLFCISYFFIALFNFIRGSGFLYYIKYIAMDLVVPLVLLSFFVIIVDSIRFKRLN